MFHCYVLDYTHSVKYACNLTNVFMYLLRDGQNILIRNPHNEFKRHSDKSVKEEDGHCQQRRAHEKAKVQFVQGTAMVECRKEGTSGGPHCLGSS